MGRINYLLDSNICIHFFKDDKKVVEKIHRIGFENCFISEMTILELYYGVSNSSSNRRYENKQKLLQFEKSFSDRIFPIRPIFEKFSEEKTRLRKQGTPISDFDLLIASTALINNCILVSRNIKEMSRVEGLKLENWID
jgi:tRNA(fMet)-specific endonuclease VapC